MLSELHIMNSSQKLGLPLEPYTEANNEIIINYM
jgi:hypothetical protein